MEKKKKNGTNILDAENNWNSSLNPRQGLILTSTGNQPSNENEHFCFLPNKLCDEFTFIMIMIHESKKANELMRRVQMANEFNRKIRKPK